MAAAFGAGVRSRFARLKDRCESWFLTVETAMADVWYRLHEGKSEGPMSLAELQTMADSGGLAAGDLISQNGTNWGAVSAFPEIRVAATAPAMVHDLNYPAPAQVATMVTPRVIELLRQTSLWVRIMSVILFVSCGLMVFLGGTMLVVAAVGPGRTGAPFPMVMIAVVYVLIAFLYIVPGILLHRYASYSKAFARLRAEQDLESAMQAQKSFWKYIVLMTLIGTGLYLVGIVVMVIVMMVMHVR